MLKTLNFINQLILFFEYIEHPIYIRTLTCIIVVLGFLIAGPALRFFFLIDNRSFIDEKNNVFTIVNSLPLKQIQINHKERLIEIRKSVKELQCVSPQIRDHSNKVQIGRAHV